MFQVVNQSAVNHKLIGHGPIDAEQAKMSPFLASWQTLFGTVDAGRLVLVASSRRLLTQRDEGGWCSVLKGRLKVEHYCWDGSWQYSRCFWQWRTAVEQGREPHPVAPGKIVVDGGPPRDAGTGTERGPQSRELTRGLFTGELPEGREEQKREEKLQRVGCAKGGD